MNIYQVYEKYNKEFIAYGISITSNRDNALDLVQDAYVKALEREEVFPYLNEHQIKAWFFTTIKNRFIDNIRKFGKLSYVEDFEIFEKEEGFEDLLAVKDMVNKLPEKNREVIYLKYQLNLNSSEIGKILNVSPSTVRSRLSASINLLRKTL